MKKTLLVLSSAAAAVAALSLVAISANRPLSAEDEWLLKNVEALARGEDDKKGYAWHVDHRSTCSFTDKEGNPETGMRASCEPNAGEMQSCAAGCVTMGDLH